MKTWRPLGINNCGFTGYPRYNWVDIMGNNSSMRLLGSNTQPLARESCALPLHWQFNALQYRLLQRWVLLKNFALSMFIIWAHQASSLWWSSGRVHECLAVLPPIQSCGYLGTLESFKGRLGNQNGPSYYSLWRLESVHQVPKEGCSPTASTGVKSSVGQFSNILISAGSRYVNKNGIL